MPIKSYPVIPTKTWWALRNRFKMTMPPRISSHYLQSLLGVSQKAAKSILPHLKAIQLIDADGCINERTTLWRDDQQYAEVCRQIREEAYPQKLMEAIPGPIIDIQAAVQWFRKATGVSINTAKKMARFYQLLSKADCSENYRFTKMTHSESDLPSPMPGEVSQLGQTDEHPTEITISKGEGPVQINLHIHMPPNASAEQIEQILSGIARHLKND
jgi:hypothetical protein